MGVWDQFFNSFFGNAGSGETSGTPVRPKKRCYYDLLEVEKTATEDEIKRAFKKQALKWHPDKNPDRLQECTAYFVLIQQAYEVLSDPQERAFYDRHRENIIHHDDGVDETRDTGINVRSYMSTSSWTGVFGVTLSEQERIEKFYTTYRELFHQLAAEDYAYIDDVEDRDFPVFGRLDSDFETIVAPFYAFWSDFSTRRSFAWLDKWDLRQAQDRATTRAMEKENKKLRDAGKRERNEEIRSLVAFVRKHDRRVAKQKEFMQRKIAEQNRKTEEARRQAIQRNMEKLNLELEDFEMDEEEQRRHQLHLEQIENELDAEFGTVTGDGPGSDEDGDAESGGGGENYCLVCEKAFKNRKSLQNHQKSRRHRQALDELRAHMRDEDQTLFQEAENEQEVEEDGGGSSVGADEDGESRKKRRKEIRRKEAKKVEKAEKPPKIIGEIDASQKSDEIEDRKEGGQSCDEILDKMEKSTETEKSGVVDEDRQKPPKKKNRAKKGGAPPVLHSTAAVEKSNPPPHGQGQEHGPATTTNQQQQPIPAHCQACGLELESRSKLFAHLKETGHATLKTAAETSSAAKGGTKKGKKTTATTTKKK